jgi:hypothetical protein
MSSPDLHSEYVLQEHGITTALHFHLGCRVWPSAPHMFNACKAAIEAMNDGDAEQTIPLPVGTSWHGRTTAPASAIVSGFNLWGFIGEQESDR